MSFVNIGSAVAVHRVHFDTDYIDTLVLLRRDYSHEASYRVLHLIPLALGDPSKEDEVVVSLMREGGVENRIIRRRRRSASSVVVIAKDILSKRHLHYLNINFHRRVLSIFLRIYSLFIIDESIENENKFLN